LHCGLAVRNSITALALAAALLPSVDAGAYEQKRTEEGVPLHWAGEQIPYMLNHRGSADVEDVSDLEAVRAAFRTWQAVDRTSIRFADSGPTANREAGYDRENPEDNENLIAWVEDRWIFDPDALAITLSVYKTETGEIIDSDIAFNGVQFRWTTTGEQGRHDVQNSATHEIGHMLGLGHSDAVVEATMAPASSVGETSKRELHTDDIEGLRSLYPAPLDEGEEPGVVDGVAPPDAPSPAPEAPTSAPPAAAGEAEPTAPVNRAAPDETVYEEGAPPDRIVVDVGCQVGPSKRAKPRGSLWGLPLTALFGLVRRRAAKENCDA